MLMKFFGIVRLPEEGVKLLLHSSEFRFILQFKLSFCEIKIKEEFLKFLVFFTLLNKFIDTPGESHSIFKNRVRQGVKYYEA